MSAAPVVVLASGNEVERGELRRRVASEAAQIYETQTAAEALDLSSQHNSAVILLELESGNADYAEICRRIRADEKFAGAIAVILPASADTGQKEAASSCGADVVIAEPASRDALSAIVHSLHRLSQSRLEFAAIDGRVANIEQQLRESRAELERLASQVCHDVEEPLRAVTTFAQLIEDKPEAPLSSDERTYLEHVVASSERVRRLLRGFLSYAQAGKPSHNRSGRVDLRIAAVSAAQSLKRRIEETGTTVEMEKKMPTAHGDFGELQQVFEHAIRNAIDYRKPGSRVEIAISAQAADAEECVVTIADNGPGIPMDHRASVFAPFKRLHGREIPGAGMGLAIARRIIEAHGGRIWVDSAPGGGAQVHFRLPLAQA